MVSPTKRSGVVPGLKPSKLTTGNMLQVHLDLLLLRRQQQRSGVVPGLKPSKLTTGNMLQVHLDLLLLRRQQKRQGL